MAEGSMRNGVLAVAGVLVGFTLTLVFAERSREAAPAVTPPSVSAPPPEATDRVPVLPGERSERSEPGPAFPAPPPEVNEWRDTPVERLKRELYELDIDNVDRLDELEAFVALGDTDPRSLWDTDWSGIDDWKDRPDDFRLERTEDGALIFVPGPEARRQYSFFETLNEYEYDEATGEFVYETEYYGKPITNIVKFLREDVMVLMVVSGDKVNMNLYGPGS